MSDSIRKPWLLDYIVAYAEQYGGELSSSQPKRGKVQIINFRTIPESLEEWVWADISDKKHAVVVRFTKESVKSFNNDPRNAGRRLTSRRWGVATIRCTQPLWCRPPTENGKGLEDKWTIALVVDQVDIAASEGEAMFGRPVCVTREETMKRWVDGLGDSHGAGGNILKLERIQREEEARKGTKIIVDENKTLSARKSRETVFEVVPPKPDRKSQLSDRQLFKLWTAQMKKLELVSTYERHQVPEEHLLLLKEITVFGLNSQPARRSAEPVQKLSSDSRQVDTPTQARTHLSPSASQHGDLGGPSTPSHWSTSQKTNTGLDDEDAVVSQAISSPLKQEIIFTDNDEEDAIAQSLDSVSLKRNRYRTDQDNGPEYPVPKVDKMTEVIEDVQMKPETRPDGHEGPVLIPSPPASPTERPEYASHACRVPTPAPLRKPIILAPDSDISGSQSHSRLHSQSQSHTQSISLTQLSTASQPPLPSSHDGISQSSSYVQNRSRVATPPSLKRCTVVQGSNQQEKSDGSDAEGNRMDTDDEAAEKILNSSVSQHLRTPIVSLSQPTTSVRYASVTQHPLYDRQNHGAASPSKSQKKYRHGTPSEENKHSSKLSGAVDARRKRSLAEITTPGRHGHADDEPPAKRQRESLSNQVVIEKVAHDANAWKEPSFVRSRKKAQRVQVSQARNRAQQPEVIKENRQVRMQDSMPTTLLNTYDEFDQPDRKSSRSHDDANPGADSSMRSAPYISANHIPNANQPEDEDRNALTLSLKPEIIPTENPESENPRQKPLKLGGWRPQKAIPNPGPGIMTWEEFNAMLLKIGRVRTRPSN